MVDVNTETTKSGLELSKRIPELDGIRGLAISLVIAFHFFGGADPHFGFWLRHILGALAIGWSGVDLFFVLSGFLIGGILLDARTKPHYFRAFYMRRVFRILPVYYLWTLLYGVLLLAVLWRAPGRIPLSSHDLYQVPLHLLFLQNVWITRPFLASVWFVVTWSLAVEEQFYLLAPVLIRFVSLRKVIWILVGTICTSPFLRFFIYRVAQNHFAAAFPMPCRADSLAWGVLLAIAWRDTRVREFIHGHAALLQRVLFVLFLGVAVLLWWLVHPINVVTVTIGYTWLALFYSAFLLTVVSQTGGWLAAVMRWQVLRWLGGISYCLYIIHLTLNYAAHGLILHGWPQVYSLRGLVVSILALLVSLAIAGFSSRYFEGPLIRRGHSYSYDELMSAAPSVPRGQGFSLPEVSPPWAD